MEKVRELKEIVDINTGGAVLAAGQQWTGGGWNTSSSSKTLHAITRVPLLSSDFGMYRNAFLYSLALLFQLDVHELNLSDRAAEAAFALVEAYGKSTDDTMCKELTTLLGVEAFLRKRPPSSKQGNAQSKSVDIM